MNKELGHAIRNRRKDIGMTQAEVAEKAKCTSATVSAVEQGRHITTSYLFGILDAIGVTIKLIEKN